MRVKLGDVCEKATSNIAQKDLEGRKGKYPIYGASGFIANVDFYQQERAYIGVVKDGAGVGRIMKLPAKSSVIGTMQYIIPKDTIDISYLAYSMEHMSLAQYSTGATIPHIYFKDYQKEVLPLPSLDEQRRIAAVLDKVSDLIAKRREQLRKLDELVKARFVEMFGNEESSFNKWQIKTFEEICELITDGEHITPRRTSGGYYLLSARNVLNHSLKLDDVDYIDQTEYERISKRIKPQEKDVLISCSGTIGRCCVVPPNLKFQMVRSVALVRFKKDIKPIFAEWLLTSDYLQKQMLQAATQSSQANLFQGKIKKLKAFVPPLELQRSFVYFVNQVYKSKLTIQRSLDKMETLKKALMQEYFG